MHTQTVLLYLLTWSLAALLATASAAFTMLRVAGALYLLYLGIRVILATCRARSASAPSYPLPGRRHLLLQGFFIQVTNPKALLFMSALLPQFIQPGRALALQLVVLLAITIAVDVLVLAAYALMALRGAQSVRMPGVTVWLERAFGAALVFFGIRLLNAIRMDT